MDGRAAYWTTVPARRTALQVGARLDTTAVQHSPHDQVNHIHLIP